MSPGAASLAAGLKQQFSVVGTYSDGTTAPITNGIDWTSSASNVVTIDATGMAAAVAAGPAVSITATHTPSGLSATASLTVTSAVLQSITIAPGTVSIAKGVDQQFTATGLFSDGTTGTLSGLSWSSSSDLGATVDSVGLASAVAAGPVPVTITATDAASGLSGSASLTVTDAALRLVAVTPPTASVVAGFNRQLAVTGFFSDGTNHALSSGISWSSSDTAVATVDASSGLVHGLTPGPAVITATETASGLAALASLTVTTAPVLSGDVPTTPFTDTLPAPSGVARYRLTGLVPLTEYLVRVTSADPDLLVQVHADAAFDFPVCTAYAGTVPCRGATASPVGELFVLVTGVPGTTFTLEPLSPLTVIQAGSDVLGAVDNTETYFKVEGLTAGTLFTATLGGLTDPFADLFVYDGPHGPLGSGTLCSTVLSSADPKSCVGTVPGSGAVYVTVEGWLTAAGTGFSLKVAP